MDFKPLPIIKDGVRFTPKAIDETFYTPQPHLFRYDMSADIRAEEAQDEAYVRRLELNAFIDDDNVGYRITYGAETHYDVQNSDETNYDTL